MHVYHKVEVMLVIHQTALQSNLYMVRSRMLSAPGSARCAET